MTIRACILFVLLLNAAAAETRWIKMQSPNFEMYSTAGEKATRETLRYFEQVRTFFSQTMGSSAEKPLPVYILAFSSMKEFEPYRLNEFATAYYHGSSERDYIVLSHTGYEIFPVAIHEYVHLIARHAKLNLPPWLNEGLAELYSTLKPSGNKIIVGSMIPGRHQALLHEKWTPLAIILAADHHSLYYNEKNKAGSLYNEGWALTHILALSQEYRPKFAQFILQVHTGTSSEQALVNVYGKPLAAIERDLQTYLRGDRFVAAVFGTKLEKQVDDIPAQPAVDFDVRMLLIDVTDRNGKEEQTQKKLEELIGLDPKRPEPHTSLGYLAWRQRRNDAARAEFEKSYALGGRNPKMLWDYGRLAERGNSEESVRVFRELLIAEPDRIDVRLELAAVQLRLREATAALVTLAPVKKVTDVDAARLFTLMAHAQMQTGKRDEARKTAERLKEFAKTDQDRAEAARLLAYLNGSGAQPAVSEEVRPALIRRDSEPDPAPAPARERPSARGSFVQLDCKGMKAHFILDTIAGKQSFLIEDPTNIAVIGGSIDLNCGPQKPLKVRVEYDEAPGGSPAVAGTLRLIEFEK